MDADEFYVEDESIEQVRAAIKRGEKGETTGKRSLDEGARAIVDRAVARLEEPERPDPLPDTEHLKAR